MGSDLGCGSQSLVTSSILATHHLSSNPNSVSFVQMVKEARGHNKAMADAFVEELADKLVGSIAEQQGEMPSTKVGPNGVVARDAVAAHKDHGSSKPVEELVAVVINGMVAELVATEGEPSTGEVSSHSTPITFLE